MPQSERQMQTGISMTRAIAHDMNAGRMISFLRGGKSVGVGRRAEGEGIPRRSCLEALGFRKPTPMRARHWPQLWPTKASVDASSA